MEEIFSGGRRGMKKKKIKYIQK